MTNNIKNDKNITILIDLMRIEYLSKITGFALLWLSPEAHRRTLAVWLAAFCCAAAQGAPLYLCPGNLFTNQLDAARAHAQGCRVVSGEGLSQASLADPPARSAVVPVAQPVATSPSAKSRRREVDSRVAASPVSAQARDERAAGRTASSDQKVNPSVQRVRDQDALAILQAELARTQAAQKALTSATGAAPDNAALQRLQVDEVALRRELERFQR